MAMSIQFDTLDYARKLETAGVSAANAELQSKLMADVLGKSVAFPGDLVAIERNLTNKIESSELKIENKLATMGGEMVLLKWMVGTSIGLSLTILTILLKTYIR
ncbi:hypothetical protein QN372_19220 [Undibacterium sp. RTI2.1]|uniref:hypothetical protein n=1 Tax=unclassified Undibacterium TaxID=2630295 RepID=UPI002B230899|nr:MULTISPECIES: hypothetical protein [unclassified Undibacterium]MEB0032884.1 hypothetical protein [Undibacterium sp. RTI2.1]MEB0118788.1 hypothetical protein [Undibacterium sp. RTI2.2]